jgi:hypothetical protein
MPWCAGAGGAEAAAPVAATDPAEATGKTRGRKKHAWATLGPQWDTSIPFTTCVDVDATTEELMMCADANALGSFLFTSAEWEPIAALATEAAQAHMLYPLVVHGVPRGGVRRNMFSAFRSLEARLAWVDALYAQHGDDTAAASAILEPLLLHGQKRQKLRRAGRFVAGVDAAAASNSASECAPAATAPSMASQDAEVCNDTWAPTDILNLQAQTSSPSPVADLLQDVFL